MTMDSERENKDGKGKVVLCVGSTGYTRRAHVVEEPKRPIGRVNGECFTSSNF
jgi:hypothetical protein